MEQKLIKAQYVADLLGCSARHVCRMAEMGKMPAAIRVGRIVRWNQQEIHEWIAAGCPEPQREEVS